MIVKGAGGAAHPRGQELGHGHGHQLPRRVDVGVVKTEPLQEVEPCEGFRVYELGIGLRAWGLGSGT